MNRLILALVSSLLLSVALPDRTLAYFGYIIFTVTGDPDDPVTRNDVSTGWSYYILRSEGLDPNKPITFNGDENFPMSFLWEHSFWTEENAFLSGTSGNNYWDYDGILRGWGIQSGTYLDWADSGEAPNAFQIFGKGDGSGDYLSFTYQDERGLHHGSGSWYTSATLPDYFPGPPIALDEPGSGVLLLGGLIVLAGACRSTRARASAEP